jgi:ADP-dependent NAD(P)H-hydrate dehydratase / NAD(P)H-hydrate epimerase
MSPGRDQLTQAIKATMPVGYGAQPIRVVGVDEMRRAEERAANLKLPGPALMEIAGRAVADAVVAEGAPGARVLVLVGPGNNGGDGLVVARHLYDSGFGVTLYTWRRDFDADGKVLLLRQRGVRIITGESDSDQSVLRQAIADADIVVDALLGTGRSRPIEGELAAILAQFQEPLHHHPTMVGLDVPTGLDADTGSVDPLTPRCDLTLTLGFPKRGLYLPPGQDVAGHVRVLDIGLPAETAFDVDAQVQTARSVASKLPHRPLSGHKGTFGRVLVIAGARQYSGAAVLTALGAARSGAGLVTLASPASVVERLAGRVLETTFLPLAETSDGAIAEAAVVQVEAVIANYRAIVIGPGLGTTAETAGFLTRLLRSQRDNDAPPRVIDADGLNILSREADWWRLAGSRTVITPHPLEMARLLNQKRIDADRFTVARLASQHWGLTVLLKGAATVIASSGQPVTINPITTSALATAGSGDVLAGLIGGLLAQGLDVYDGACVGAFLHGLAGATAGRERGEAGVVAGDILEVIPRARQALLSAR